MADKRISELVELTALATDDVFPVVDSGASATKRITAANLSKFPAGVTIPDGSTIGSASDPDAMSIAAGGVVEFTQGIKMAAGKGIDFSAYGSGVDSNLLDDYEEGTWTPTLSSAGNSGATSITPDRCVYTKIGNMVAVKGSFTSNGDVRDVNDYIYIGGLPFSTVNSGGAFDLGIGGHTLPSSTNINRSRWLGVTLAEPNTIFGLICIAAGSGSKLSLSVPYSFNFVYQIS